MEGFVLVKPEHKCGEGETELHRDFGCEILFEAKVFRQDEWKKGVIRHDMRQIETSK